MTEGGDLKSATAIILAAGKGTRMKSAKPKVLHDLCGRSLLGWVIEATRSAGVGRIVVVVGHERDQIRCGLADEEVVWVVQEPQQGTGHALQSARRALPESAGTLLLLYGDVPLVQATTLRELGRRHREAKSQMTVLTARVPDPSGYGRILRDAKGGISAIREDADATAEERSIDEINTGLYCFESPRIFSVLDGLEPNERKGEVYLTDALAAMAASGERVASWKGPDSREFLGVNNRVDLARAGQILRRRILERLMIDGVTIVDPTTTFIDADVEIGADTVIHPCTVIRSGVKVGSNCEVGPFTHLRVDTVMEDRSAVGNFTEVKRSRIGKESKAKHLTYLGDSVIGQNVNVGAGTITANYDGSKKWVTKIGDNAFIGSGTIFVAPAVVAADGVTGAGAVVVRGTRVEKGEVYIGIPAKKQASRKAKKEKGYGSVQ